MKDKEVLEYAYKMNWLNKDGLRQYIGWLRGELKDHSERIKEVIDKKGLHKEGENVCHGFGQNDKKIV